MQSMLILVISLVGFILFSSPATRADDQDTLARETQKFQGHWTIVSSNTGGKEIPREQLNAFLLIYEGDKHTLKVGDQVFQVGTQKIDPAPSPKTIDITMIEGPGKGTVLLGIYKFDGDTMTVCFDPQGKKRPTEFKSTPGSLNFVNVHQRVKK